MTTMMNIKNEYNYNNLVSFFSDVFPNVDASIDFHELLTKLQLQHPFNSICVIQKGNKYFYVTNYNIKYLNTFIMLRFSGDFILVPIKVYFNKYEKDLSKFDDIELLSTGCNVVYNL